MFKKDDFARLAAVERPDTPVVTIYSPTHRAGEETHNGVDRITFKDAVKEAARRLESTTDLSPRAIETMLQPLRDLDERSDFWKHQSDTLAAFLGPDGLQTYALPVKSDEARVSVGARFMLSPAAGMLAPDARYYVFTLARGGNAFYEATRHSITPVYIHDEVPVDLEEVMAPYVGDETLQAHSGGSTGDGLVYSGQGSNEDRLDEEERIYYERVTAGLDKLLAGQTEPLILVCAAQHATEFKRTFHYPHVLDEGIDINPDDLSPAELHTETWRVIQPRFDQDYASLTEKVEVATGAGRFVASAYDAVPAAINGQVDTLFVASDQPTPYGTYDAATNSVHPADGPGDGAEDLMELAIRKTVENGGRVFSRASFVLPDGVEDVGAVLRYAV